MYRDIWIVLDFINYQNSMQNVDHRPTSVSLLISPTQPQQWWQGRGDRRIQPETQKFLNKSDQFISGPTVTSNVECQFVMIFSDWVRGCVQDGVPDRDKDWVRHQVRGECQDLVVVWYDNDNRVWNRHNWVLKNCPTISGWSLTWTSLFWFSHFQKS